MITNRRKILKAAMAGSAMLAMPTKLAGLTRDESKTDELFVLSVTNKSKAIWGKAISIGSPIETRMPYNNLVTFAKELLLIEGDEATLMVMNRSMGMKCAAAESTYIREDMTEDAVYFIASHCLISPQLASVWMFLGNASEHLASQDFKTYSSATMRCSKASSPHMLSSELNHVSKMIRIAQHNATHVEQKHYCWPHDGCHTGPTPTYGPMISQHWPCTNIRTVYDLATP